MKKVHRVPSGLGSASSHSNGRDLQGYLFGQFGSENSFFSKCPDNCTFLCCGNIDLGFLINVKQYQSNNHIFSNNDKQLGLRVGEEGADHNSAIHLPLNLLAD